MIFKYIHEDNSKEIINLDLNVETTDEWVHIKSKSKLEFIKEFNKFLDQKIKLDKKFKNNLEYITLREKIKKIRELFRNRRR